MATKAALAVNPTDFGNYIGLTYCQGVFYPVWADNSGAGGNPDGANTNFATSSSHPLS